MKHEPLIQVRGVAKSFGDGNACTHALRGVDLDLSTGSFSVLEGRSGSGKTTLLNIIGALDLPDQGRIQIGGESFLDLSKDQRATFRLYHIGFVFQSYNLLRVLSARENVAFPLQMQGLAEAEALARADRWLHAVDLGGLERRRPEELSGGQQQRVAVARALVTHPSIVLADEPTANLDSENGGALMQLLRRINAEHQVTFLIASHDPAVIASARHLITLRDGQITKQATFD